MARITTPSAVDAPRRRRDGTPERPKTQRGDGTPERPKTHQRDGTPKRPETHQGDGTPKRPTKHQPHHPKHTPTSAITTRDTATTPRGARWDVRATMKSDFRETAERGRGKRRTPPRCQRRQPTTPCSRHLRQHSMVNRRRGPMVNSPANPQTARSRTKCLEITGSKRHRYPVLRPH